MFENNERELQAARMLSPTQRRHLKQLAHPLKPLLHMGKEGPSNGFICQLLEQLEAHELLKLRILNNCASSAEEIESPMSTAGVSIVQKLGHVYTVYKGRLKKPAIHLPKR